MNARNTFFSILAAGLLIGVSAHIAASASSSVNSNTVTISNNSFSPSTITVPVGATVTWTNNDSYAHTVTMSGKGGFDSGSLDGGKSWSHTFSKVGTYNYVCSIHPSMTATVVVVSASPAPTSTY